MPVEIRLVIAARIPKNSAMKAFLFWVFLFFWFVVLSRREQRQGKVFADRFIIIIISLVRLPARV